MSEIRNKRTPTGRTYDLGNGKFAQWSNIGRVHYGENLDAVDMRPQAIAGGWEITANDWHYQLGNDGWVGFGGKAGAHWLRFRLRQAGYVHFPTRALTPFGGVATYNIANLTSQNYSHTNQQGDTFHHASAARWSGLWPGVGVQWAVRAGRLKEEITMSQATRENLPAPTTPLTETYLTLAFQIDHSDIPKIWVNSVLQDKDSDFTDDAGGVVLTDAADEFLAFLPIDYAYVNPGADDEAKERLVKRFYKDGSGNYWLLVGLRLDKLANLPAGDLVFDPTVDVDVAASGDDGAAWGVSTTPASFANDATQITLGHGSSNYFNGFIRFVGVTIAGTVSTAYMTLYCTNDTGDPYLKIIGIDEDNPSAPANVSDFNTDTGSATTNQVDFDIAWTVNTAFQTSSIVSIVQELVDSYTISNDAIMFQLLYDGNDDNYVKIAAEDNTSKDPPSFYCEYATAVDVTVEETHQLQVIEKAALTQAHSLAGEEVYQLQVVEGTTLSHTQNITVYDIYQIQPIEKSILTQAQALGVEDIFQLQVSEKATNTQAHSLTVGDVFQLQVITGSVVTITFDITVGDVYQLQVIEKSTLTQAQSLSVGDIYQLLNLEKSTLTQGQGLSVGDIYQLLNIEKSTLTQAQNLSIEEIYQLQVIEKATITQGQSLSVEEIYQLQVFNKAEIGVYDITVESIYQLQVIAKSALTQLHSLSVEDIFQQLVIELATLAEEHSLSVGDLFQLQAIEKALLTQAQSLTVGDLYQLQAIEKALITQLHSLSVGDIYQLQLLDKLVQTQSQDLTIGDIYQQIVTELAALAEEHSLEVADIYQRLYTDSADLTQAHALTVDDLYQLQTLDKSHLADWLISIVDIAQPQNIALVGWFIGAGNIPVLYSAPSETLESRDLQTLYAEGETLKSSASRTLRGSGETLKSKVR